MFRRPKYTYYSYSENGSYRGSKKKYKAKKRSVSEYDEIKDDAYRLFFDVKKLFSKKKPTKVKIANYKGSKQESKTAKFICLGIIGFILMSSVITFPIALLVCLTGVLLYSCK